MPEKPSRRDRRRSTQRPLIARRPQPASPISPDSVAGQDRPASSATVAAPTAASPVRPPGSLGPGASGARLERRAGIGSSRAPDTQREERVRKEAFRDLRQISLTAVVILVLLAVAAITLR